MIEVRLFIAYGLMILGGFFALVTTIGIIRFPDLYTRIHAGAVTLTISALLITIGTAVYVWDSLLSLKILAIGLLLLVSNPMATHAIARVAYQKGIALPKSRTRKDVPESDRKDPF